ncbi:hypothetical protein EDC22_102359 [Tepidamorphus gemmatus]|uniref:Uncharacterized protein n=1 Tax=Tepidamorphus gemmatus TaxID=747076 RepID=A0A4R3MJS2_9HYPH|nr:hypothetical protein [Tepidamorphus gemmatus]TCT12674.1 hypothetical protein EDC22_102359 [Tepidamorphus gemmatus]
MALSPAEKQRRYRERQKVKMAEQAKQARHVADDTAPFLAVTFADFLRQDGEAQANALPFIQETLGSVGLDSTDWEADEDPEWHEYQWDGTTDRGLLGKAERMVGAFLDSARALSELINRYKLQEIDRALAEIERADLSDPEAKKQALADVVRLNALRKRLHKEVRYSFPATVVKGE